MKFLHAADIHLDSPMQGVSRRTDAPVEALRDCTRRALTGLVDLAIEEDVACLIIAGDLYDGDWKDYGTGVYFAREMRRLGERPVYVVLGNHDAASTITKGLKLSLPANVHLFPTRGCETVDLPALGLAIHGRSFAERHVTEDMSAGFAPPLAGRLNIGVLHTSCENLEHERYAPCTAAGLAARGYQYWALGHVHERAELSETPRIVFPGNLQGRNPRETGIKGASLVHVEDGAIARVEHRAVDVLRWAAVAVDLDGADGAAALRERAAAALATAATAAEDRLLAARVTLAGETPLHPRLLADAAWLDAELRQVAPDGVWIERVRLRTAAPRRAPGEDALSTLLAAFDDALDEPALVAEMEKELNALVDRLPHGAEAAELRDLVTGAGLAALAAEARALVSHRLAGDAAEDDATA
ncbi:MAG TPA: DNA repair exonuclease [Acetobacteraceae bacterium]|nr:DNA repair exonuclease [Acetobacteraceae bacterium]